MHDLAVRQGERLVDAVMQAVAEFREIVGPAPAFLVQGEFVAAGAGDEGVRQQGAQPAGDGAHGSGELAVDGVTGAAGRCSVVGLVHDQQGAWPEAAEGITQARGVGFVGK